MLINTNLKINNEENLNKKEIKKRQKKSEQIQKNNVEIENNVYLFKFKFKKPKSFLVLFSII